MNKNFRENFWEKKDIMKEMRLHEVIKSMEICDY